MAFLDRFRRQPTTLLVPDLREFVYLDEVSMYSLLSSRKPGVRVEFREDESLARTGELTGRFAASAGVVKSEMVAHRAIAETQGTQIVRKVTVQANFNELYGLLGQDLLLKSSTKPPERLEGSTRDEVLRHASLGHVAVEAMDIRRGQLLEIEVEFHTETLYQIAVVVRTFAELLTEAPELVTAEMRSDLSQVWAVGSVLDKLLVGLVPLRGRALNYVVAAVGDAEWIVHQAVAEHLSQEVAIKPLHVVGLANASSFWKDIRLVAFSGATYSVLARVDRAGLHDTWTPVRLFDVMRELAPELAQQLGPAGEGLLAAVERGTSTPGTHDATRRLNLALEDYGRELAAFYGREWDPALLRAGEFDVTDGSDLAIEDLRHEFDELTRRLEARTEIQAEREVVARLRSAALTKHGLMPLTPGGSATPPAKDGTQAPAARILDTELIAIYW